MPIFIKKNFIQWRCGAVKGWQPAGAFLSLK